MDYLSIWNALVRKSGLAVEKHGFNATVGKVENRYEIDIPVLRDVKDIDKLATLLAQIDVPASELVDRFNAGLKTSFWTKSGKDLVAVSGKDAPVIGEAKKKGSGNAGLASKLGALASK